MIEKKVLWAIIGLTFCIVLATIATLIACFLTYVPIEIRIIYIIAPLIAGMFVGFACSFLLISRREIYMYWIEISKNAKPDISFLIIYFICLISFIIYREPWTYTLGFTIPAILVYVLSRKYEPYTPLIYNIVYGFFMGFIIYYFVIFYSWLFTIEVTYALLLTPYPQFYTIISNVFNFPIFITFLSILPFTTCEEMMFRRVLKVLVGFGLFETVFITQMIFVSLHALTRLNLPLVQYVHTLVCISIATVIIFYTYYSTGSIVASIIAHNTYNTLIFKSLPLSLSTIYMIIIIIMYVIVRKYAIR